MEILELIRDIGLELKGVNSQEAEKKRKQDVKNKKEEDRENKVRIIIPVWAKNFILTLCLLYLLSSFLTFSILLHSCAILLIVRNVLQMIIALSIAVMIRIQNKKTEIACIVMCAIFIVLQGLGTMIFGF